MRELQIGLPGTTATVVNGLLEIPLPASVGPDRNFHVLGSIRRELGLADSLFSLQGSLLRADAAALARLADWLSRQQADPASHADLIAAVTIHELMHLLLTELRSDDALNLDLLATDLAANGRHGSYERLVQDFRELFPPGSGMTDSAGKPELLEELLLVYLHNRNPAFAGVRPLLDDRPLQSNAAYVRLDRLFGSVFSGVDDTGADPGLLTALRKLLAPQLAGPRSLRDQLTRLERQLASQADGHAEISRLLLLVADVMAEHKPASGGGGPAFGEAPSGRGELLELAAAPMRASEADWMQETVIIAKNCLVWLDQLSRRHGQRISRLDQIPDSELAALADSGINSLWLIGIWRRSAASRRIKQLTGQPDAAASAYSIHAYGIAPELGGDGALEQLRDRAHRHGIRLVADMVPNHTALDSDWVLTHPERFMRLTEPPFPSYSFTGPELSVDPDISIMLEDHYWDNSDAAVVFRRHDRRSGRSTFIYHGNDGTGLPWNDTAQLDYLNPDTRRAVLEQMVQVARRFPVIRFDAAMTLVSRHIQRLWYPPPGAGGAIASRALHGSTESAELERKLPGEFWSEAVSTLQREAPGTLLIAEAFWMLEEYFVQNLGLHRVYNSAFMHMIRDHANSEFLALLQRALDTDPELLQRFVNFLSNPDEDSAAGQFGTGDRYFVACTLLATLPGLPLFGHGQLEGLKEKYGMEFTAPQTDETTNQELLARHAREITPLLNRRSLFAGSQGFELFAMHTEHGVAADVIAFSKHVGSESALVVVNNSAEPVSGRLLESGGRLRDGYGSGPRTLAAALGASGQPATHVSWRRLDDGLEYAAEIEAIMKDGLYLTLPGYGRQVLLDISLHVADSDWRFDLLDGEAGFPDVRQAAAQAAFRPFRDWLLGLPEQAGDVPPLPGGHTADAELRHRLLDRARRLKRHTENDSLAAALAALTEEQRTWLLLQGLDRDELLTRLVPGLPGLFSQLPWRPEPGWWSSEGVKELLGVHEAAGAIWFAAERFDGLAAAFALRGALRAGTDKGAELWDALQAAAVWSEWRFTALPQLPDGHSDG